MNSPQSQKLAVGSIVERYTTDDRVRITSATIFFILSKTFFSINVCANSVYITTNVRIITKFAADICPNMSNDWKNRLGVVYSTNPDFKYVTADDLAEPIETLAPERQKLVVSIDRRNRGGKQVTLVSGFVGREGDLAALAKTLKTRCGVGGSAKDGEILIQGDFRDRIVDILTSLGFRAKRGN